MEWLKNLIDLNKISNPLLVVISITTAIILFGGEKIHDLLHFSDIDPKYNLLISLSFLVSTVLLFIRFFAYLIQKLKVYFKQRKYRTKLFKILRSLDPSEKAVIREFFLLNSHSIEMPINDPTISGLISKNIIYRNTKLCTNQLGELYSSFSLNNQIKDNVTSKDIDFPANDNLTEDEIIYLKNNRPHWAKRLH